MTGSDKLMTRQAEGCLAGIMPGFSRLRCGSVSHGPWMAQMASRLATALGRGGAASSLPISTLAPSGEWLACSGRRQRRTSWVPEMAAAKTHKGGGQA